MVSVDTSQLAFVVDDSLVVRKVAAKILTKLGFRVSCHADGVDALHHCRREMPDLVLLDWHMPRMDGIEFLRKLKDEYPGRMPRIALCRTENHPREISEALDAGADEYIMKPFDEELIRLKPEQIEFTMPSDE